MLKKLRGRIRQSKLLGESLVTEHEEKLFEQAKSVKVTVKNSTTSASIVPEVWIMFGLLLSLAIGTGLGNPRDRK